MTSAGRRPILTRSFIVFLAGALFTNAWGALITLSNASFESPDIAANGFQPGDPTGWVSVITGSNTTVGVIGEQRTLVTDTPAGDQWAHLQARDGSTAAFGQAIGSGLEFMGETISIEYYVTRRANEGTNISHKVQIVAGSDTSFDGGVTLDTIAYSTPLAAQDTYNTATGHLDVSGDSLTNTQLWLVFENDGIMGGSSRQLHIDNVIAQTGLFVPGDVDGNGVVDEADLTIITSNFYLSADNRADGDLTGDGLVDFADYRVWKDIFDPPPGWAPGISVPEPSAEAQVWVMLLVFGACWVLVRSRRKLAVCRATACVLLGCAIYLATLSATPCSAVDDVAGNLILFNDNGGWCWYQDERTIYDPVSGNLIIGSVANYRGFGGEPRDGDIDAMTFNLATGSRTLQTLSNIPTLNKGDDHNTAAFWKRPDGRYLAVYTGHLYGAGLNGTPKGIDTSPQSFYRISTYPNDGSNWQAEQTFTWPSNDTIDPINNDVTYSNLHYMANEGTGQGRLYNIARAPDRTQNFMYSDDLGESWTYGGKISLTTSGQGGQYSNGYFKFSSNAADRIDFIATEHHPRNFNNSIYHGYIQNGKSYDASGTVLDENIFDEIAPAPAQFTPVWTTSSVTDSSYHHGWTAELERDASGNLYGLFTTRYGTEVSGSLSGDADHRLFYARFDAATSTWSHTELSKMGGPLHAPEQDYTGIGSIHPNDPNTIYISTPFDPRDDASLGVHEIFKGVTADNGATWQWTPITENSTADNLRPIIPSWDADNTAVLWLRGDYPYQRDYDQTVVGIIDRANENLAATRFVDASSSNTTRANGSPLGTSGPSSVAGAADGLWHERTGLGNGGSILTSGETGAEDAGLIKTTARPDAEGTYDVFAYFWAEPGEQDWVLRAGMQQNETLVFRQIAAKQVNPLEFQGRLPLTQEAGQALYQAYVGRVDAATGQGIEVYLDDSATASNGSTRTLYEGIGLAQVVTETNFLTARIDRSTGEIRLVNESTSALSLNRYELLSAANDLDDQNWNSLTDQGLPGWSEGATSQSALRETRAFGQLTLNPGEAISLGGAYQATFTEFGQSAADSEAIAFNYSSAVYGSLLGDVLFEGDAAVNTIALRIDTATGEGVMINLSAFSAEIEGYTITSADGSLVLSSWTSLDDQGVEGNTWVEAVPAGTGAARLSEVQMLGATLLNEGDSFNLGSLFSTAGDPDGLAFGFLLAGDSAPTAGAVVFELFGDFNNDGTVDTADFTVWRDTFGSTTDLRADGDGNGMIGAGDYTFWKAHFGNTSASGSLAATAVPEPASLVLLLAACGGLAFGLRREKVRP